MNIYKNLNRASIICLFILGAVSFSCDKDFLTEYNPANRTTDNYYNTAIGFEGLVNSCYPLLRDMTQRRKLTHNGTDLFVEAGYGGPLYNLPNQIGPERDVYDIRFNSSNGELQTYWDQLYKEINRCNAAVTRKDKVVGMEATKLTNMVAQAKFLRAISYFFAVQQWGDIPMPLTESLGGSLEAKKSSAKDVYTQIIADLNDCIAALPATQADQGRVTKGAAQFLLAKVYLTRAWNFNNSLGGSEADFTKALSLCDELIASNLYPLEANWNTLWPSHNKNINIETASLSSSVVAANASKEVVFAVQYANPLYYKGDGNFDAATGIQGNNMHSQFGGGPSGLAQVANGPIYGRQVNSHVPTWAAYRLFDPKLDSRYEGTYNSVSYATTAGSVSLAKNTYAQNLTINYIKGDTTGYIRAWNNPVLKDSDKGVNVKGGTKKYNVTMHHEMEGYAPINATTGVTDNMFWGKPMFWKFFQPAVAYADGWSTLNDPIFRSAELYLMAAEAIVKGATGAKLGTADVYYNVILDRALASNKGKSPNRAAKANDPTDDPKNVASYRATPATINIDMILDESARELLGESFRWNDLKRTKTLISRNLLYNPWTKYGIGGTPQIKDFHYLRPIPQGMLDVTNPKIEQNPGY
ncbi:MAG: RagB/SusD family nutrient uptake outer membrane protein [Cytophagales bacterium]|nr:RagB/SusD family nutrient uptake outer membrane protein [Cytophagales bacterium]